MTARILTCTDEEYFADPCDVVSLSQSIATKIVTCSPLHGWAAHPKLGGMRVNEDDEEADKPAQIAGNVFHSLILGKGPDVECVQADSFRTKAAQEERDRIKADGGIPLISAKYDAVMRIVENIRNSFARHGIKLEGGAAEVAVEWDEAGVNRPVRCRGKMDYLILDAGRIFDVKKSRSAHPEKIARSMIDYGYDIQHAAYTSAIGKLRPEFQGKVDFTFLFFEDKPPYAVTPCEPDGSMREHGHSRWSRAVEVWERCIDTGRWPDYTGGWEEGVVGIPAPHWAMQKEIGNEY